MEKPTQDKSSTDTKKAYDQDPDRYDAGYGSFNEEEYEKKRNDTPTGQSDEANIKEGMNEDKSTISDTAAPSESVSDKDMDTNSNAS